MTQYKVLENIYLVKEDVTLLAGEVVDLDPKRVKSINTQLGREGLVEVESKPKKASRKEAAAEA